jgi:hypothetical protein
MKHCDEPVLRDFAPVLGLCIGGFLVPALMFLLSIKILRDPGGPLFWPVIAIPLGLFGVGIGCWITWRPPFSSKAAIATFCGVLILNGITFGFIHLGNSEGIVAVVLAWLVGWGVNFPGMFLAAVFAGLGVDLFWQADASEADLYFISAIALISALVWSVLVASLCGHRKLRNRKQAQQRKLGDGQQP